MKMRKTALIFLASASLFFLSCTDDDLGGECSEPPLIELESGTYSGKDVRLAQGLTESVTVDVDLEAARVEVAYILDDGRQVVETYTIKNTFQK